MSKEKEEIIETKEEVIYPSIKEAFKIFCKKCGSQDVEIMAEYMSNPAIKCNVCGHYGVTILHI